MKTIKTALFVTALTMTSASAFAQPLFLGGNYISREEVRTVSVAPATSTEQAYQEALSELNALKQMPANKLNKTLNLSRFDTSSNNTHLKEGGYITVQERMNETGQLEYVGRVNVKVHYAERDSNN